jgi:integrase
MMATHLTIAAGHLKPHQLSPFVVDALVSRWRRDYAAHTAYGLRHMLARFLGHLTAVGAPPIAVPKVRPGRPKQGNADAGDVQKLFSATPPHMRLFLHLTATLGMRFSEATSLRRADWNAEAHTITFRKKGGSRHTLPVSTDIEHLLEQCHGDPQTPCIAQLRGPLGTKRGVITPGALRREFYRIRDLCGANHLITPHDLRRFVATAIYDVSKDLRAVQQVLGHEKLATSAGYIRHIDQQKLGSLLAELRMPTEVKQ